MDDDRPPSPPPPLALLPQLVRSNASRRFPCTYGEGIFRKSYNNNTARETIYEDSPYCPMIINGKTNNTIAISDNKTFRLPGMDNIIFEENDYPQRPLFKKSKGTKKSKATKKSKGTKKSKWTKKSKGAKRTKKSN